MGLAANGNELGLEKLEMRQLEGTLLFLFKMNEGFIDKSS